jgi:hypothetical protein
MNGEPMIKAIAERNGVPMILIGLSEGNLAKLRERKPILTSSKMPDGYTVEVLILWGQTEAAIMAELGENGVVVPTVPIETTEGHRKHVKG